MIAHDKSMDFTVVKLRQHEKSQKFFITCNALHSQKDADDFCACETSESISQGVNRNKIGSAAGILKMNDESYSHATVMQKRTILKLVASYKGAATNKMCYNDACKLKMCNFGHKKITMKRLTKKQKHRLSMRHTLCRNMLAKEALSCIASIACIVSAYILLSSVYNNYF